MRHADCFVPGGLVARFECSCEHPLRDLLVRLTPGRPQRVAKQRPTRRPLQHPTRAGHALALERVTGLDQTIIGGDLETELRSDRPSGFLRAL